MRAWRREPLAHFLVGGLMLFAIDHARRPTGRADSATRIEITDDDVRQIDVAWRAQWQRPPTPSERQGMLDARIREEILYREGLAMGLDRDDTIVRRRLVQKMEFLAEDVSSLREPAPAELRAWFAKHPEPFVTSGLVSFRHLFFSFDRRGPRAREEAARTLARVQSADAARAGDPFMFQDSYGDRSPDQVASIFGSTFAQELFRLRASPAWQGPIESGFGWHLVRVESMRPGRVPTYEEVEAAVKTEWRAAERAEAKRSTFEAMKARYQVVLPTAAQDPS